MVDRRASAVWNAVFGYATITLALVRNIVLVPIYLRFIPLSEFGLWMATGGALVNLFIVDFGLSGALSQRVAQYLGSGEHSRVGSTVISGLVASGLMAVLLAAIAFATAPFLPMLDAIEPVARTRALYCFQLAIVTGGVGILNASILGLLRSFHRPIVVGLTNLSADILSVLLTVVLLFNGWGLYALAAGLLMRSSLVLVAGLSALIRALVAHSEVTLSFQWAEFKSLMAGSWYWLSASIAMKVQTNSNTVVVAGLLGPASAAVYGLTVRAHETLQALLLELAHAVTPSMAHLYGERNTVRMLEVTEILVILIPLFAALGFGVAVAADPQFVAIWVGSNLYAGHVVSSLMALAIWVSLIGHVGYNAVQARGDFKEISRIYGISALVHVAALCLLTRFGMWGAPMASLLSATLMGILFWENILKVLPLTRQAGLRIFTILSRTLFAGTLIAALGLALPNLGGLAWLSFIARVTLVLAGGALLVRLIVPDGVELLLTEIRSTIRRRRR